MTTSSRYGRDFHETAAPALIPGGLGVRELVVIPLLRAPFGAATALVCAVLLRVCWMVSEALVSIILYLILRLGGPPRDEPVDRNET